MILIADSGSTKTDWHFVDSKKNIHHFVTIGFNPYFQDSVAIAEELQKNLQPKIRSLVLEEYSEPLSIHFYGAGCSSLAKNEIVNSALHSIFPKAQVHIEHDLLAAARALMGNEKGIAGILGTGSNSCYYDGSVIVESITSTGFILGDEGSGAWIGKKFIGDYINNDIPKEIADTFYERYHLSVEDILDAVYTKPMPNKFLASFCQFLYHHKADDYVNELLNSAFDLFLEKQVRRYSGYNEVKLNCVGSVAFNFSENLKVAALKKGITLDKIIENPISDLTNYHLLKLSGEQ